MTKRQMNGMLYQICRAIEPYNDYAILKNIILDIKYEPFWTGKITRIMLNRLMHIPFKIIQKLMHRYKFRVSVLLDNDILLKHIHRAIDINILTKHNYIEQQYLIKRILKNHGFYYHDKELLEYIIYNCDYSSTEWQTYKKHLPWYYRNNVIINNIINSASMYCKSLRATWIMACISL